MTTAGAIEISTDFPFMDERRYVHGTTLLSTMLELLEKEARAPVHLRRIKFQREVHANGRLVFSRDEKMAQHFKEAPCFMICEAGGDAWIGLLYEEQRPVAKKVLSSYRIEMLKSDGKYGGACRVQAADRADLVRTIVEANKRFHLASLPQSVSSPKVRMGYIEDWNIPEASAALDSELRVQNLVCKPTPKGVTTLNRLSYQGKAGHDVSLMICFDVVADGRQA